MHRTNPDSLESCPCFRVFCLNFASDFLNLPLARFHQVEIIVLNSGLIPSRVKPMTLKLVFTASLLDVQY